MLQLVFFCGQNVIQELATEEAVSIGLHGIGLLFTVSETVFCAAVPALEMLLDPSGAGTTALRECVAPRTAIRFAIMAAVLTLSTGVANVSVEYISIATLVVLKGAKLLPVMCVGMLGFGKKYKPHQWLSAVLLVAGVVMCIRSDAGSAVRFNWYGIVLVLIALTGDAMYPYLQESMLVENYSSEGQQPFKQQQMLVGTNILAAAFAAVAVAAPGTGETFTLLSTHRWLSAAVFAHGLLQYLGLFFYLLLLKEHSPRTAVSFATVRKAATVLLSFILAGRSPTFMYAVGASVVFGSLLVEKQMLWCPSVSFPSVPRLEASEKR